MDKLKMHSKNWTDENIAKLAELFPNCVTEVRGTTERERGSASVSSACSVVKKAIDFDLLRQELSAHLVDGPRERYRLDWPGKREALLAANAPIAKSLRPCRNESVDFDNTENLFIEGDNLDALKLLQETYLGKVKMIYIDPPYNTGNDFIYADNFAESADDYLLESGQKDEQGNRLVANTDSNGRFHSDWLSMMYSRLKLARNLLRDDGVIFISIDDGEVSSLRRLCDEIFGQDKYIADLIWKSRQNKDNRTQNGVSVDHEYVVTYGVSLRGDERDLSGYSNPDCDPRGDWTSANMVGLATADRRPNLHYNLTNPNTGITYECPPMGWRYDRKTMGRLIAEQRILWPSDPSGRPRRKSFASEFSSNRTGFSSIIGSGIYTRNGTADVVEVFGYRAMDFPKPVQLVLELVRQGTQGDDLILDFFAGSATTAHAVMQLNAEDGGKRKFIMVQLPEACDEKSEAYKAGYKTIAEISKERIRRAGKKIKDELEPRNTRNTQKEGGVELGLFADADNSVSSVSSVVQNDLDIGFRVLKVDSSNLADVYYTPEAVDRDVLFAATDNLKPDRSAEDLLFQVLLDWGVDLTLPITREMITTEYTENTEKNKDKPSVSSVCSVVEKGVEVFFVDGNALAACFAKNGEVTEAFCRELAKRAPLRVVFRDAGFKDDSAKINAEQIFKQLSPRTEVRCL